VICGRNLYPLGFYKKMPDIAVFDKKSDFAFITFILILQGSVHQNL
jgi:hypothetical protein